MRTTDFLDQLYNPTNDFFISEFQNLNSFQTSGGGGGGATPGGNDVPIYIPAVEPPVYTTPIVTPELPITQTPKVNIKLGGLENGFVKYADTSYFDGNTIELNVLTTLDSVNLKPEGAEYSEYYVISFEDVVEEIPVKDDVILGGTGGGGNGGIGGGGFGSGIGNDNPILLDNMQPYRNADQNRQK